MFPVTTLNGPQRYPGNQDWSTDLAASNVVMMILSKLLSRTKQYEVVHVIL